MRSRFDRTWIAALSLTLLASGCAVTRNRGTEIAATPVPTVDAGTQSMKDLPSDRAAKVCLTVAAELEKNGYESEAIDQYEKARKHDPRSIEATHRLAVLYDRQGDVVRAQTEYRHALEMSPKDPDLLNDMGYFCYERGNWSEAETRLRKALAAAPKHARARVNLGMTLAQQGKSQEALAEFTAVLSPAEAQANLGMIQAQRGQLEEAKQAFRKSLDLEPSSKVVRAALSKLEKPQSTNMTQNPGASRTSKN